MALKYTPPGWNGGDPTLAASFPGYTAVTINNDGSNRAQNLTAGVDYYLNISDYNATVANLGGLTITGGRNVVIVGGRMRVDNIAASPTQSTQTALKLRPGATGTYHIEGLDIGGTQLCDAIAIQSGGGATASTVIQIQNCYIQNALPLAAGQTPAQAIAAGTHPDGVQFQTAFPGNSYFYQNTIRTTLQGIFYKNEGGGQMGIADIRRTNIRPILEPTGTKTAHYLFWQELATECPVQFPTSFSGVEDVYVNEDLTQSTFSFTTEMYPDGTGARPGDDYTTTTDGTGTFATWNVGANITGRVYKGLPSGGDYVVSNGGTGGASIPGIAYVSPGYSTDTTAPTAPTSLVATVNSNTQITLTWTAATDNVGVTQYRIERCQGSGCSGFVEIGTDTASPFVNTGLTAGTTYNYRVRAADAAGNLGPYSNTATAATSGGTTYTPTVWVNGTTPAINATNLNKLKNELASQALAQGISHSLPTWVNGTIPAVSDPAPLNEMERVADLVAASLSLSYTPTTWSSGWIPARNATNLNHLENQAQANRAAIVGGGSGEPTPTFYYDFDFVEIADPPYTSVQWDNDPGADGPGAGIQATPDGYSVSLVNAPIGGGRALRFEIRDADGGWPLDTTGMRSQVRMDSFHTWNESPMVVGDIRWFLFEMYLPNNSPAGEYFDWGRGNYNTWMGLHPDTGNTSGRDWGCFDIGTDGPYTHPFWMTFKIAGGGGVNPYDQLEYPRLFQLTNADGSRYAPNYNRRIRVLLGGKFSPIHANGWYEAWVDGVNVLPRTAHATMWTGDTVTYFKCGPYKSATNPYPTNGKTVMYWTRIAFGT